MQVFKVSLVKQVWHQIIVLYIAALLSQWREKRCRDGVVYVAFMLSPHLVFLLFGTPSLHLLYHERFYGLNIAPSNQASLLMRCPLYILNSTITVWPFCWKELGFRVVCLCRTHSTTSVPEKCPAGMISNWQQWFEWVRQRLTTLNPSKTLRGDNSTGTEVGLAETNHPVLK